MQKELRLLKKDVNGEMTLIRSSFSSEKAQIGKPGFKTGFMGGLFGKKNVGKMNALQRDGLRRQQMEAIAPYENVKRAIDEALVRLDQVKGELDRWMLAHKDQPNPDNTPIRLKISLK